jgi:hypothetical protein
MSSRFPFAIALKRRRAAVLGGAVCGVVSLSLSGSSAACAQDKALRSFFNDWRAESWFYFRKNSESSDNSQQNKLTLRFYQPFDLGKDWHLTMREDIPFIRTDQIGQDNLDGQWKANIGDMFVQGSLATPSMAPGLSADLGLRLVFPTGGLKPFGDGYYQLAPHFGFDWKLPGLFDRFGFAPLARYFRSVGATVPHGTEINQLQLHPVVSMRLNDAWSVVLWQENKIIYDFLTTGWFVPIDILVKYQINPALSVGLGGAVGLLQSYPQYDNIIYGRLSVTF